MDVHNILLIDDTTVHVRYNLEIGTMDNHFEVQWIYVKQDRDQVYGNENLIKPRVKKQWR